MARTVPEILIDKLPSGITSACSKPITASLTSNSTTTAELNIEAFSHGSVYNVSGVSVVVTYYTCRSPGSYAVPLYDQDGVAVTQTIPATTCWELPTAIAGVPHLVPVSTAETASLIFVLKR